MKKKLLSSICFAVLLTVVLSCTAFAASYSSSLSFQGEHTGVARKFTGSRIMYTATTYSSWKHETNKTYNITLYKKNGIWPSTKIGDKVTLTRDGKNTVKWTGKGSGEYYIEYRKARDGVVVKSNNVVIKDY